MNPEFYGVYLLVTEWCWDHTNREIATITNEGVEGERYEEPFESLANPYKPLEEKQALLRKLKRIASAQNGSQLGEAKLIRLYRMVSAKHNLDKHSKEGEQQDMHLVLKTICEFDADENPIVDPPYKEHRDII